MQWQHLGKALISTGFFTRTVHNIGKWNSASAPFHTRHGGAQLLMLRKAMESEAVLLPFSCPQETCDPDL